MTLINFTYNLQNATPEDVTQVMANFTTIRNVVNGNLDDTNVKSAAGIAASKIAAGYLPSKLAQEGATAAQGMVWSGSQWAPSSLASALLARQASEVTVSNTAAETDLFRYNVPGGTLGTDKAIWVSLRGTYNNNSGSARTFTLRIKYGSTTAFADDSISLAAAAADRAWACEFFISTKGTTGTQVVTGWFEMSATSAAASGIGDLATQDPLYGTFGNGSLTEDSTAAKDLAVTFQHSAANGSLTMKQYYAAAVLLG